MKKFVYTLGACLLMTGLARAGSIAFTGMSGDQGTVSVGTLATIVEPGDQSVLTSLSYTVSGLTIDAHGVNNDTATFTIPISPVGAGPINWDVTTVSEFDYNGGTFGGTSEGITFGAITVSGTGSGGQGYQLDSALYTEWTVRRWGAGDTMTVVGDLTGTQNLAQGTNPNNTTLNDTTFTATAGDGTWNGLNVDFCVDVSSVPEPSSLVMLGTLACLTIGRRRRRV